MYAEATAVLYALLVLSVDRYIQVRYFPTPKSTLSHDSLYISIDHRFLTRYD